MDNARGGQDQALESDLRPPSGPRPAARRRVGILFAIAALVYALDVVTKVLVVAHLTPGRPVHVIGTLVQFDYTRNSGAAFSIGWGDTVLFTLIAFVVVIFILRLARKLYSAPWAVAFGLLLGGALGNLTDRVVRAPGLFRGWVVDFVQLPHFAIFNLADAAISCGGVLMVLLAFRGLHPDGTDERAVHRDRQAAEAAEQSGAEQPADEEPAARGEDPAGPADPVSGEETEREHEHR